MKHARTVILHLCCHKVKVSCLVICDTNIKLSIPHSLTWTISGPGEIRLWFKLMLLIGLVLNYEILKMKLFF